MSSENEVMSDIPTPDNGATAKPKRQLTEAQRLAFLKARETRARNVEIRREQKLAHEATEPAPVKKPRAKKARTVAPGDGLGVETAKPEPTKPKPMIPEPTREELEAFLEDPEAKTKLSDHTVLPDPEAYAKLVADIIYDKLNAEIVDMPPMPPPKPRRRRREAVNPAVTNPEDLPQVQPPKMVTGPLQEKNLNQEPTATHALSGATLPNSFAAPTPTPSVGWM